MTIKIALYESEEGFAVCAPSLPGCWSQGVDEADAIANIKIAIREYLEADAEVPERDEAKVLEVAV